VSRGKITSRTYCIDRLPNKIQILPCVYLCHSLDNAVLIGRDKQRSERLQ
jgi:hypothetical protein